MPNPSQFHIVGIAHSRCPARDLQAKVERTYQDNPARSALLGFGDALVDFIADPRFAVGFVVGTMFTVVVSFMVAFL
jgi:hypothetical protein